MGQGSGEDPRLTTAFCCAGFHCWPEQALTFENLGVPDEIPLVAGIVFRHYCPLDPDVPCTVLRVLVPSPWIRPV